MKVTGAFHYLLMLDEAGSRSYAVVEGSSSHARRVATVIANNLAFRVKLTLEDGSIEFFEPEPMELVTP